MLISGVVMGFLVTSLVDYYRISERNEVDLILTEAHKKLQRERVPEIAAENVTEYLFNKTRVLCIVMTDMEAFEDRGFNIYDTWGKRCNRIFFFSDTVSEFFSSDNFISRHET